MIPTQLALAAVKISAEAVARFQYSVKKRDAVNVDAHSFSAVRSVAAPVWNTEQSMNVLDLNLSCHTLPHGVGYFTMIEVAHVLYYLYISDTFLSWFYFCGYIYVSCVY